MVIEGLAEKSVTAHLNMVITQIYYLDVCSACLNVQFLLSLNGILAVV